MPFKSNTKKWWW